MVRIVSRLDRRNAFGRLARQTLIALGGAVALAGGSFPASAVADEASIADFPIVIYCEFKGTTTAYYFSRLANEEAVYLSPDRQAGLITVNGTARRVGGPRSGSCLNKTLADLRASGQALDMK